MTTSPEALREAVERLTSSANGENQLTIGRNVFVQMTDLTLVLSALQEAREAEGHYVCGFQQANMEARMIVAEVLGDTAENAAIQAELVATADRRALSPGGARDE